MPVANLPRVTVCLLTYKRASLLPRTLDSLLAQSHGDFELIVNDDCSPDNTAEVCREYARRDKRVRYCRNPANLRYAGNQNAALLRSKTELVAIVHDGDIYRHDMIESWTRSLVAHPTAAIAFNAAEQLDREGRVVGVHRHPYEELVAGRGLLSEMLQAWGSPIFGIVMVRRSFALAAGPFDPRFPVLADVDMWMRLLLQHDAAYVAEPLYAISPRESDHTNTYTNWRVLAEQELIYALNHRRFVAQDARAAPAVSALLRMFWKNRMRQLLACLRHGEFAAAAELAKFIGRAPRPMDISDEPDAVTRWEDTQTKLSIAAEVSPPSTLLS